MNKNRLYEKLKNERQLRGAGVTNLKDYFLDTMFEEMEEMAKSRSELLSEQKQTETFTEEFPTGFRPFDAVWRYEPVDSKYFFGKMFGEACTERQQEAVDVICGKDPFEFTDLSYDEVVLMWGKGSGKDSTIGKCFSYQTYKLCCMIDPQKFLGLGKGSPIDVVNVASNATQAKNIFFQYFVNYIKNIKDLKTGLNWFATNNFYFEPGARKFKYMDLRESEGDILKNQIDFHRGIKCHSLTSDKFTAEGLTLILAVMDEVGAMKEEKIFGVKSEKLGGKILGQYDSLGSSVRRSSKYGKIMAISYKYGVNCPMSMLFKKVQKDSRIFSRKYTTYQVRTDKPEKVLREQFRRDYEKDPEKARLIYENIDPVSETSTFISNKFTIEGSIDQSHKFSVNPFKGQKSIVDDISLGVEELLEKWFRGDSEYYYAIHLDLAKGRVWDGGDAVGIVMSHMQQMRVSYDKLWIEFYKKEYGLDLEEYQGQLRMGIVTDLMIQVICKRSMGEVRIADVRKFCIDLQDKRGFGIIKVTADRWGSEETIQEFNRYGIEAEQFSVDRSKAPYYTWKDYMQQGIYKTYDNFVWKREVSELLDVGNKIDHPDISTQRFELEGVEHGSKELTDGCAANAAVLVKELSDAGEIFLG